MRDPLFFRWLAVLLIAITFQTFAKADVTEIFVAPGGNDAASGTKDQPLATPERARALVRERIGAPGGLTTPVRVVLRGGTYFLAAPLALAAEDSGTTQCPVSYIAAPGETPILSGGRPIKDWKPDKVNGHDCWVADLAALGQKDWNFKELFVDGARRPRTRLPKEGYFRFDPATPKHDWTTGPESARFVKGDLKSWANLADVELIFLNRWFDVHERISSIDETSSTLHFAPKAAQGLFDSKDEPARYWIENVREALDTPGQWYLDRPAGKLYYLPLAGETPEKTEVIAPVLDTLLQVGNAATTDRSKVRNLRFEHLAFRHANAEIQGPVTPQAACFVRGAIKLANAESCTFYDCAISLVGGYGMEVQKGSRDCQFLACRMEDLGAGGLRIEEGSRHTIVSDCTIRKGGRIWLQACGILLRNSGENRITYNHISDLYYTGISSGWTWGYAPTETVDNQIEYNLIHDLGYGVLDDMGGIYTLGAQPGSVLRGNVIHDVFDYFYGGWGIYHDEGSSGFVDEDNLVYRTNKGGFHQHYGRDNLLRNNIFATAVQRGLEKSRLEQIRPFVFEHNIVYLGRVAVLLGSNWSDGHYEMRDNLYWRDGDGSFDFAGKSFAEWQAAGFDAGSRIADPLFTDPTGGNFTLRPGSPALAMGFKPFDPAQAGPRPLDPRGVALEAWPRPHETAQPILEWRLETEETLARQVGARFDQKIELSEGKPQSVSYIVANRGKLPAQGSVEFRLEPAGAATLEGEPRLSYDLKPGERAEVKFKVNATPELKGATCKLEAVGHGDGLRNSVLYFN